MGCFQLLFRILPIEKPTLLLAFFRKSQDQFLLRLCWGPSNRANIMVSGRLDASPIDRRLKKKYFES